MMAAILMYLFSGCATFATALWIVGDLAEGQHSFVARRMALIVLAWRGAPVAPGGRLSALRRDNL
mgnify:CR=1 FL=1